MHGDHVVRCAVQIARGPQSVTDVCCMAGGFLDFLDFLVVACTLGNPHGISG